MWINTSYFLRRSPFAIKESHGLGRYAANFYMDRIWPAAPPFHYYWCRRVTLLHCALITTAVYYDPVSADIGTMRRHIERTLLSFYR